MRENKIKKKQHERKCWVKPALIMREEHDLVAHLLKDFLFEDDEKDFFNFTRLTVSGFKEILRLVIGDISKQDTVMRQYIPAEHKLAITLRYLGSGDSYKSLEFLTRISKSAIVAFVPKVCKAIYTALQPHYLKWPLTTEDWLNISGEFNTLWQCPHTLGALDGKHIRIKAPHNSGSYYYNFKGFHSIVLFAAVDARGRFIFVDVGSNGKVSDSTIFSEGELYRTLKDGSLNIPQEGELVRGSGHKNTYFFVGDDAFALDKNVMKPYNRSGRLSVKQQIFNYRMCQARIVVECAFGKLASRFRVYHRLIELNVDNVDIVILATCALHNYVTKDRRTGSLIDECNSSLPDTFLPLGPQTNNGHKYACRVRDSLADYFMTDGSVEFQWRKISVASPFI